MRAFPCRRVTNFVPQFPEHNRRATDCRDLGELKFKPQLETLEPRQLMTADNQDWQALLSSSGACTCPICTGQGLNSLALTETVTSGGGGTLATTNPLTAIPLLSSNPGATAKLFLDFNGNTQASWGSYTNVVTPVYDQDGDLTSFSDGELASIQEIWARVAEDYAPFNIDVTTIDPGNSTDRVTARIAIGGNYTDWFGQAAGGVAYIGGFYNSAPNVGFVFKDALANGTARYVAEAASHEAGHLFGLQHQATWNGSTLVSSYSQGNADWAPIMGVGYYSTRTTWHNGATDQGPNAFQDDLSILSNGSNGFGYRTDDFGSTQALASALAASGGNVNFAGRISTNTDEDWFSFTSSGGSLNLTLNVASVGANLDSVLELRDSSGSLLVSANPTDTFGATLSSTLGTGTYYVVVKSSGGYGNLGQYTLTGTAPIGTGGSGGEDTSAPEITILNGATNVLTGGSISFGSVQVGNYVDKTITIKNTGTGPLTLTSPTAQDMPAGYTIVTNLGSTVLAAGDSTSLTVRFTPTATGTTAGALTLVSDDSDEGSFVINLTGTATPAPAPEINVLNGTTNVLTGGSISFGSVQVGNHIDKVITVKNTGTGPLTLTAPTAQDMPAGYSIVSNLGTTTLAAGASTTFTVRFTPTAAGTTAGALTLVSDDADEGSFVINLTGTATPAPAPEISVLNGTTNVLTGGSINWGNVQVSKYADKTITVKNTGNAALTIIKPTAADMPAGFTIVTNFTSTSIAAGMTGTIKIRYTPTSATTTSGALTLHSNDSDEGSFVINLTGTGTPGPQPEINVLNGTVNVLTGGNIDFGSVQLTKYANKTITIKNTGTAALTIVKPTAADLPAGFSIVTNFTSTSIAAGMTGTITLRYTPTALGATSGALTLHSNDSDESSFVINLSGTGTPAPAPEIDVLVGGVAVQSGGSIDFGSVQVGQYINKTITVKNTGTATLTLVKPTAAQMPVGFTIVTNFASTSLAAGASASLTVRYTPTVVGATGGVLNLVSSDADEGTFALNLTGTGTPAPIIKAIDNGAAGFTQVGTWTRSTYLGRESDIQTALKGNGGTTATWTFTDLPAGQYKVHATWTGSTIQASDAPFTVYDGATALATVDVNQRVASSGLSWSGSNWSNLGTFNITGNTIRVVLTNLANERVVADAIRVERIGDITAPSSVLDPAHADALPVFVAPTSSSGNSFTPYAPLSAATLSAFSPISGNSSTPASSPLDELFAVAEDSGAELLLINEALDLWRTAEAALNAEEHSPSEPTNSELASENWLLSEDLNSLLR